MQIAKFDIDILIPLIIGVFWVISQIAATAAKKKAPPPRRPAPDNGGTTNEDPFADLMRKLGGVQEFKIPKPPEPETKETSPWQPGDIEALPDVKPVRRTAPVPEPEPVDVPVVNIRPTMGSFKSIMPAMKLPAMNLSFQTSESAGGRPKVGKIIDPADRQTLRRAVLGHVILGKPKAFEGWSTGTVE